MIKMITLNDCGRRREHPGRRDPGALVTRQIRVHGSDRPIVCDDEDYEFLAGHSWSMEPTGTGHFYPRTRVAGKKWTAGRLVCRGKDLGSSRVRHADGDVLNVTRANLITEPKNEIDAGRAQRLRDGFSSEYRHKDFRVPAWEYVREGMPRASRRRAAWMIGLVTPELHDQPEALRHGFDFPAKFVAVEKIRSDAKAIEQRGVRVIHGLLSKALITIERRPDLLYMDSCAGFNGDNELVVDMLARRPDLLAPGAVVVVNILAGRDKSGAGTHRGMEAYRRILMGRGRVIRTWKYKAMNGCSDMHCAVFVMPE